MVGLRRAPQLEWIVVLGPDNSTQVGALGFLDNKVVAIAAFHDHRDGDNSGTLSTGEKLVGLAMGNTLRRKQMTEIAMWGSTQLDVVRKDAAFASEARKMWLSFAAGLVQQAVYQLYIARGVKMVSRGVAVRIAKGRVKQMIVRKGMEKAVKEAMTGRAG